MIDLAYGEHDRAVADLLEHIDDPDRGERLRLPAGPAEVACPTVWGVRRTAELRRRLAASGVDAVCVPRAVAVARSHADAAVRRCAVVETALLPDTGGDVMVHLLVRRDDDWHVADGAVDRPADIADHPDWARLLTAADVVIVDGPDEQGIDAVLCALPPTRGGVVRADRALVARHGGRTPSARRTIDAAVPPPPVPAPGPRLRWAVVAAVLCGLAAVAAALLRPGASPAESSVRTETVGDATLAVPADWRRTDLDEEPADGAGVRAVFVRADDGARLVVVVTRLRPGSTRASVAESLRNRIAQRGDGAVTAFAPDTLVGDRRVVSYRETPASGPPISWYVDVHDDRQTSIGCQAGADPIDAVCAAAVTSLRVVR